LDLRDELADRQRGLDNQARRYQGMQHAQDPYSISPSGREYSEKPLIVQWWDDVTHSSDKYNRGPACQSCHDRDMSDNDHGGR
jgi:hypothetical protein